MNLDCTIVWFLEVSILPHPIEGHCKFLGLGGGGNLKSVKAKLLEERCEQATCKLELPVGGGGGGEGVQNKSSVRVEWIFSGTTHCHCTVMILSWLCIVYSLNISEHE